jgi:prepilin-type N-terminal cleavage/methylation domain-containing protein
MKMRKLMGKGGFTLVEIMIVVAIIGLLAAIAIPNFIKARETAQKNACIANLRQISGAKTLWALDSGPGDPDWGDLVPDYIQKQPSCPTGASYNINPLATEPTCNSGADGHAL